MTNDIHKASDILKLTVLFIRQVHTSSVLVILFLFKGIYARHLLGNASSANAAEFGESVEPLAELGLQIALRYVIPSSQSQCLTLNKL